MARSWVSDTLCSMLILHLILLKSSSFEAGKDKAVPGLRYDSKKETDDSMIFSRSTDRCSWYTLTKDLDYLQAKRNRQRG